MAATSTPPIQTPCKQLTKRKSIEENLVVEEVVVEAVAVVAVAATVEAIGSQNDPPLRKEAIKKQEEEKVIEGEGKSTSNGKE